MLAVAPDDDDDDDDADGSGGGGGGGERWVPGRVLAERHQSGVRQYKISLDGYDSEDDAWVDEDDPRVRPYEAVATADAKEAAKAEQAERDAARRFAEQRKVDARSVHARAIH